MSLTPAQQRLLEYLAEDDHYVIRVRHKLYEAKPSGDPLREHIVNGLLAKGYIWRHPYTLRYVITEPGKKYLQNL